MAIEMHLQHLSDSDLERYVTGMMHYEPEVQWAERHLYACPQCAERMEAIQDSLDDPDGSSIETSEPDLYGGGGPKQ